MSIYSQLTPYPSTNALPRRCAISQTDSNAEEGEKYSIGAVVKLTGLTSHNIRVWEKRHQAVVAERHPSGRRYYTQAQVNRLLILKRCISHGYSISELASLDDTELQEKIDRSKPKQKKRDKESEKIMVAILSQTNLASKIDNIPNIDIAMRETLSDFREVHLNDNLMEIHPDVILMEVPSINADNVKSITELVKQASPDLAIAIYRFGNQTHLNALRNQGLRLLRAPLDDDTLTHLLTGLLANNQWLEESTYQPMPNEYPTHLFTAQQLAKIVNLPSKIDCECPHHLVDILQGLKAFERYSGECVNQNDEDAALHGKIQLTTATARQQIELLLHEVLSIEGIEI